MSLFLTRKLKHKINNLEANLLLKKIRKQTKVNISKKVSLSTQIANLITTLASSTIKEKSSILDIINSNINIAIKLTRSITTRLIKYITSYYT